MKRGVQLYNFRESLKEDFRGTLKEIAKIGFDAVEFAVNYGEIPPQELAACLKELKLECCGAMFREADIADSANSVYDYARALHAPAVTFSIMAESFIPIFEDVKNRLAAAGEAASRNGFVFAYHNHWKEFEKMEDGVPVMEHLLQATDPGKVFMEPDICWVTRGGSDPAGFIRKYGKRIRQIHIKDIVEKDVTQTLTELGKGCVDIPGAIAAAKEFAVEYLIYEQDISNDPFKSAAESLAYLKKVM